MNKYSVQMCLFNWVQGNFYWAFSQYIINIVTASELVSPCRNTSVTFFASTLAVAK